MKFYTLNSALNSLASTPSLSSKVWQDTILTIFYITLAFYSIVTHSQDKTSHASSIKSKAIKLSNEELLKQAKSFNSSIQETNITLANVPHKISKINNGFYVSSHEPRLLGNVAEESKYNNELLPVTFEYEKGLSIALTLIAEGDEYYQQKRYTNAIKQYKESLKHFSSKDKNTKQQLADIYTHIGDSYRELKNSEQATYYYKKALNKYTELRNKKKMARSLHTLSLAERYLGNLVIALDYSTRGLEIHKQIEDPEGRAKALTGAGIIYRHIGRYEKSLKHIYEAHLYYKKNNKINGIAVTSNQMGLIYTRLKQYDQARSFYQKTIDLSDGNIEQKTLASALREMAVINLNLDNYEIAQTMAQSAQAIYKNEKDKTKESTTARIIGNIYRDQNDKTNAINYYRESLSLAKQAKSELYQIKSLVPLASILIGKNTSEAISLLKYSLELSIKTDNKSSQLYAYRLLRKAKRSQGKIIESLNYAEKEIAITAVIQNERENSELVLQKANLHSHKMEIELESLREKVVFDKLELTKKNNEIEISKQARMITELELMKNKYSNIALALLLAICILMVVLIYRRFMVSNKRNRELDYLAAHDPLTNCYNRRVLFEHMNQDLSSAKQLKQYCIIMVDIDHFKQVNDTFGHSAGDSVLRGVASIFQGCVRKNDIVARFGGEEFCIILHQVSKNQALSIAEVMRQKVENSCIDDISVTCSFGVTSIEFNAQKTEELIEQADLALYKSKSLGRNQVTLWDRSF